MSAPLDFSPDISSWGMLRSAAGSGVVIIKVSMSVSTSRTCCPFHNAMLKSATEPIMLHPRAACADDVVQESCLVCMLPECATMHDRYNTQDLGLLSGWKGFRAQTAQASNLCHADRAKLSCGEVLVPWLIQQMGSHHVSTPIQEVWILFMNRQVL